MGCIRSNEMSLRGVHKDDEAISSAEGGLMTETH